VQTQETGINTVAEKLFKANSVCNECPILVYLLPLPLFFFSSDQNYGKVYVFKSLLQIMSTRVLTILSRLSSGLRRLSSEITIHRSSSQLSSTSTASIFEPIPREELVTKVKSRLRGRQFLPGSSEGGFPEFLAEPRDSFPLSVRVDNSNQSSLTELTARCMEHVEENFSHSPAILFRGLPAKTSEDFSIIANAVRGQAVTFHGGMGNRDSVDKDAGTMKCLTMIITRPR